MEEFLRLGSREVAGSFYWFQDQSNRFVAHNDLYVQDIDGDGTEEIFFAGFETQPNTPAEYSNISTSIFGWSAGQLNNVTSQWLPNGQNHVEGVGDVVFGDFNGDSLVDVFFSGYADMDYEVNAYAFYNKGGFFERTALGLTAWEHGANSGDINNDGYLDVLVAGYSSPLVTYLGSPNGLVRTLKDSSDPLNSYITFGSGVSLGDFLNNGSTSVVVVDSGVVGDAPADTLLLKPKLVNTRVEEFEIVGTLPAPRLENPSYNLQTSNYDKSHDVRARTVDFNRDGLDDIIVWSRAGWTGSRWPEVSQIQFLRNEGGGEFADVTGSTLEGYTLNSNASYSPRIMDFNRDGWLDIFVSSASFEGVHDSTALFLGQPDGRFLATESQLLSSAVSNDGGVATLAWGPDQSLYFISNTFETSTQGLKSTVYFAELSFPSRETDEYLPGSALEDRIEGLGGNDRIEGRGGNDWLDGGDGIDQALYGGRSIDYEISELSPGRWQVSDQRAFIQQVGADQGDGEDTLVNIERLVFSDVTIALDLDGVGGKAYRVYKAAFDREPDSGGLGYWIGQMDNGMGMVEVAARFIDSDEFRSLYGTNPTNGQFLTKVYNNVLDRDPDAGGYAWWIEQLENNPEKTWQKVLADFSESPENQDNVAELIANGIPFYPWAG